MPDIVIDCQKLIDWAIKKRSYPEFWTKLAKAACNLSEKHSGNYSEIISMTLEYIEYLFKVGELK